MKYHCPFHSSYINISHSLQSFCECMFCCCWKVRGVVWGKRRPKYARMYNRLRKNWLFRVSPCLYLSSPSSLALSICCTFLLSACHAISLFRPFFLFWSFSFISCLIQQHGGYLSVFIILHRFGLRSKLLKSISLVLYYISNSLPLFINTIYLTGSKLLKYDCTFLHPKIISLTRKLISNTTFVN